MKKRMFILLLLALTIPTVHSSGDTRGAAQGASSGDMRTVYICTGPKAKVYHTTRKCKGLRKCSGSLKPTTVDKAKDMGRRACKICG